MRTLCASKWATYIFDFNNSYHTTLCVSATLAVGRCPSVRHSDVL